MKSTAVIFVTAAVALVPACTLAQVDADVDSVCLTYPNLQVPAVADVTVLPSIVQSFQFDDLGPVHTLLQDHAQLTFQRAAVRTSDADALAGIDKASLGIADADPGSTLPHAIVYACSGDCMETDAQLELPANSVTDALGYLSSKTLSVDLSASGALPAHAWAMDVDVCMSGHAQYNLTP